LTRKQGFNTFSLKSYFIKVGEISVTRLHTKKEFDLSKSAFYKKMQHESKEILKLKSEESKKLGQDIDYDRALIDWIIKRSSRFRKFK